MILAPKTTFYRRKKSTLHSCLYIALRNMHTVIKKCSMHIAPNCSTQKVQSRSMHPITPMVRLSLGNCSLLVAASHMLMPLQLLSVLAVLHPSRIQPSSPLGCCCSCLLSTAYVLAIVVLLLPQPFLQQLSPRCPLWPPLLSAVHCCYCLVSHPLLSLSYNADVFSCLPHPAHRHPCPVHVAPGHVTHCH